MGDEFLDPLGIDRPSGRILRIFPIRAFASEHALVSLRDPTGPVAIDRDAGIGAPAGLLGQPPERVGEGHRRAEQGPCLAPVERAAQAPAVADGEDSVRVPRVEGDGVRGAIPVQLHATFPPGAVPPTPQVARTGGHDMQRAGCIERRKHTLGFHLGARADVFPAHSTVPAEEHRSPGHHSKDRPGAFEAAALDRPSTRDHVDPEHVSGDIGCISFAHSRPTHTTVLAAPKAVVQAAIEDHVAVVGVDLQPLPLGSPGTVGLHRQRKVSGGERDSSVPALVDVPSRWKASVLQHVRATGDHAEVNHTAVRRIDRDAIHAASRRSCRQGRGHSPLACPYDQRSPLAAIPAIGVAHVGPTIADGRIEGMRDEARHEPARPEPHRPPAIERLGRLTRPSGRRKDHDVSRNGHQRDDRAVPSGVRPSRKHHETSRPVLGVLVNSPRTGRGRTGRWPGGPTVVGTRRGFPGFATLRSGSRRGRGRPGENPGRGRPRRP